MQLLKLTYVSGIPVYVSIASISQIQVVPGGVSITFSSCNSNIKVSDSIKAILALIDYGNCNPSVTVCNPKDICPELYV